MLSKQKLQQEIDSILFSSHDNLSKQFRSPFVESQNTNKQKIAKNKQLIGPDNYLNGEHIGPYNRNLIVDVDERVYISSFNQLDEKQREWKDEWNLIAPADYGNIATLSDPKTSSAVVGASGLGEFDFDPFETDFSKKRYQHRMHKAVSSVPTFDPYMANLELFKARKQANAHLTTFKDTKYVKKVKVPESQKLHTQQQIRSNGPPKNYDLRFMDVNAGRK